MKRHGFSAISRLIACTVVAVTACSSSTAPKVLPLAVPDTVSISPATVTLTAGQTQQFTTVESWPLVWDFNVYSGWAIPLSETWSSSDNTKATVSATGLATALVRTPGVAICFSRKYTYVSRAGCATFVVPISVTRHFRR
jgi:hypothetical protein